jgi:hypothetical protein
VRSLGIDNSTKWECDPHLLVVVEAPCLVLREYLPEMDELERSTMLSMGKSTISIYFDWAIFNSYVKLSEGN